MGACNSKRKTNAIDSPIPTKNEIKNEKWINGKPPQKLDKYLIFASKSLCYIQIENTIATGFLIQLFKIDKKFFCLMTCEHVITREMIRKRKKIIFYYDSLGLEAKLREIVLNPNERFIQDFRNLKNPEYDLDITVIEILPTDNIPNDYFLSPDIEYMYNFNYLKDKEIAIIQYPKGDLSYDYGKINMINKFEFSHLASTDCGSSGSPIFLKNSIKVIGIHKSGVSDNSENYGHFIGPIFNYFKNFKGKKYPWNENKIINNVNIINNIDLDNIKDRDNIANNYLNNIQNNQINQITLIYNVDKNKEIFRIFGYGFVKNNMNNCHLLINGNERELCKLLYMNEIEIENNKLEIKLIVSKPITDMSDMFSECLSLISLSDISKWNTSNVTNMSHMFYNCISLVSLPDISKWNTSNVTNISHMFYNCNSLISLPDLSKWNTTNVTNMSYMFCDYFSLVSLPDISKWNTPNVTNISHMFCNCNSLVSLPDLSKWDTKCVTHMDYLFSCCISLVSLPDISKWNTSNVTNMSYMFCSCYSFASLPDLSKWNTTNVIEMDSMFYDCSSLVSLPDISKWNTSNVINMNYMFYNCKSLRSFPNISDWKLNK